MQAVTLGVNHISDFDNTMSSTPPNTQQGMVDPVQLQQLVQLLGKSAAPKQTAVVECPKTMVGRVIGKGGETIKSLQQYTGAMIQIDQSTDPTRVTIAGSPQSLQLAVSMVNDIVRGTFKGFAMLRQIAMSCTQPGIGPYGQPSPIYVQGYGFVPPSQVLSPEEQGAMGASLSHLSPTGPLTPPITPMRANGAGGGGEMSADTLAALLGAQQGGMPGAPPQMGPSQDALISQLLSQVAAQQQQQQQFSMHQQQQQQPQFPLGAPTDLSGGLDQATIQTMLAQAGLMGAGQVAAAQRSTPGMAQSIGATPGLPPSSSLMLSAQGTPAVLGQDGNQSPFNRGEGGLTPTHSLSSPLGSIGSPGGVAPSIPFPTAAATSPLATFMQTQHMASMAAGGHHHQQQPPSSFLGTSPSTASASSPVTGSGRTSPAPPITGLTAAANPLLSSYGGNRGHPGSGDSSPLGRYGAIGTSVSPVSHIGSAAEDALAARLGSMGTADRHDVQQQQFMGGGGAYDTNKGGMWNSQIGGGDPQGLGAYNNLKNESSLLSSPPPTTSGLSYNRAGSMSPPNRPPSG